MNENKLIDFLNKNNGYIKTRDFEKLGISRPSIQGYIDKKIIRKVSRGLYIDNTLIDYEENMEKSVKQWAKDLKGQGTNDRNA